MKKTNPIFSTKKISNILDKTSSYLFFLGLAFSKIRYLPTSVATPFFNIGSIVSYMIGYIFWLIASYLYPEQKKHSPKWYSFASFKDQNIYAATLGIIATLLGIGAFFVPVVSIPAVWLFLISNMIWTVSQYYKLKSPTLHEEESYSPSRQKEYLHYAIALTASGLVAALSTTLIFFIPPLGIPLLIGSTIVNIGLGIMAFKFWLNYNLGTHTLNKNKQDTAHSPIENTPSFKPENKLELLVENSVDLKAPLFEEPPVTKIAPGISNVAPYHLTSLWQQNKAVNEQPFVRSAITTHKQSSTASSSVEIQQLVEEEVQNSCLVPN